MSQLITFAANNDVFRKRKRVHRACDACRSRRKRCCHTFDGEGNAVGKEGDRSDATTSVQHVMTLRDTEDVGENVTNNGTPLDAAADSASRETTPPRFVGYLNPEAILRDQERGKRQTDGGHQNICGSWISPSQQEQVEKHQAGSAASDATGYTRRSIIDRAREAYLDAVDIVSMPRSDDMQALVNIYFESIQPLLPIIDERSFRSSQSQGKAPRPLLQAICIVASKHERAGSHLSFPGYDSLLTPRQFANRLAESVVAAVEAKLVIDKVVLIQVLMLLSLHSEGANGGEQASMFLAQAIHHAYTFGLQFSKSSKHAKDEKLEKLFWCLWALDKLNACIHGRALVMHDRDGTVASAAFQAAYSGTPFGVFLQLSTALDKVISYYRPAVEQSITGWEDDFPSFEDIVGEAGETFEPHTIAMLELYYHTVAMASHRIRSIKAPVRSTPSYTRQSLSAVRVISILSQEATEDLPPLPIVPYALSMALTVAYRCFRQSKLQKVRNRAKEDIKTCCRVLEGFRDQWWSAGAIADIGKAALVKADNSRRANDGFMNNAHSQRAHAKHNLVEQQDHCRTDHEVTSRESVSASALLALGQHENVSGQQAQHSSTAGGVASPSDANYGTSPSDWLDFDNAFEDFNSLTGISGGDLANDIFSTFNYDGYNVFDSNGG